MSRLLLIAVFLATITAASAQQPTPNPQIVIQEIAKRQNEEMQKAIMCEVGKDDLQKRVQKLTAELEALKPVDSAPNTKP
jgi:hypothetical protein